MSIQSSTNNQNLDQVDDQEFSPDDFPDDQNDNDNSSSNQNHTNRDANISALAPCPENVTDCPEKLS